jgi:3',5'-cyclic AMP phosphodiesterase CpdA
MMITVRELVAVGPHSAELFVDGRVVRYGDLEAATSYHFDGVDLVTLESIGESRSLVVTMNDVHFGEIECGKFGADVSHVLRVGDNERPYPEVMNESVIADALSYEPDAVVVRGDLTSFGTLEEYEVFLSYYVSAFAERLTYVRGNHDSYPGNVYADWPVQIVRTNGLAVVLLDTSRLHESSGFVSAEQCAAVSEFSANSSDPVIVMGHHPLFVPGVDRVDHFDGVRPEDSAVLISHMSRANNVLAYSAGHTHRCRRRDVEGVAIIEVACTKDFPGAWAEYQVGSTGVAQIVHRASGAQAISWAERTRTMFDGYYGTYALGELSDRCFVLGT